jgi:hypothetical protein
VGSLITFAATGHGPFGVGVDPAVLYRVVHEPPALSELAEELRELFEPCLAKDPQCRPDLDTIVRICRERCNATSPKLGGDWIPRKYTMDHQVGGDDQLGPAQPADPVGP